MCISTMHNISQFMDINPLWEKQLKLTLSLTGEGYYLFILLPYD